MSNQDIICCFIPECMNTSIQPPGKRFARVPCLPKLRQLWVKAGLRLKIKIPIVDRASMFCCEDHFDLQFDATKQWLQNDRHYEENTFIKLKRGVLPHKFKLRKRATPSKSPKKKADAELKKNEEDLIVPDVDLSVVKIEPASPVESLELHRDNHSEDEVEVSEPVNSDHSGAPGTDKPEQVINSDLQTHQEQTKVDEEIPVRNVRTTRRSEKRIIENKKTNCASADLENAQDRKSENSQKNASNQDKDSEVIEQSKNSESSKPENTSVVKAKSGQQSLNTNNSQIKDGMGNSSNSEISLKRSAESVEGTTEESVGENNRKESTKKKRRKIVKEILAWIPSDPSVVPQLRTNSMQPFLVVQTPPATPGSSTAPLLQLPSQQSAINTNAPSVTAVPLASGKETQFVLTVPDKYPLGGTNGQQVMLAVPQGCSFSVDKLPAADSINRAGNQTASSNLLLSSLQTTTAAENTSKTKNNTSIRQDTPDHNYNSPNRTSKKTKHKKTESVDSRQHGVNSSENAVSAITPTLPAALNVAATPNSNASHPTSSCTCCCSSKTTSKRSIIDTTDLLDGSEKLSNSLQTVVDEFSTLKRTVSSLTKELQNVKLENTKLRTHNRLLLEQKQPMSFSDETRKLELAAEALKSSFTSNQIRILLEPRSDKGRVKWTDSEMDSAYMLSRISSQAYKYLLNELNYPFPSLTTLRRYIEKMESEENKRLLNEVQCPSDDLAAISTEDDALARAILDADSEEELERDEGAIREMEEMERKKRLDQDYLVDRSDEKFAKRTTVPVMRHVKVDSQKRSDTHNIDNTFDKNKVTKLHLPQHSSAIKQLLSDAVAANNSKRTIKKQVGNTTEELPTNIIPKVVRIQTTVNRFNNEEQNGFTPTVREVIRQKKELPTSLTLNMKENMSLQLEIPKANDNMMKRRIVKIPATSGKTLQSNDRIVVINADETSNQQADQYYIIENNHLGDSNAIKGELIITHENENISFHESNYEHSIDETKSHIITGYVNSDEANSKMFQIEVEPLQGEQDTMYEEVVIHCDDPEIFNDSEVVGLAFHDGPMDESW